MHRSVVTALTCLALAAGAFPAAAEVAREASEKVIPAAGIRALVVENRRGAVEVRAGGGDRVHLVAVKEIRGTSAERRRLGQETQVSTAIEGGTLTVRVTYPASISVHLNFWDLFNGFDVPRCDVRLTLDVPAGLVVSLRSSSGDLSTRGLSGLQNFETSSGDVEVRDAGGMVQTSTSSGDVTAEAITGARMRSSSGDLKIDGARGPLDLRASSGDIEVRGAADSVTLVASSGDVTLESAPRGARVRTESGQVEVGSASGRVVIGTSSGDVRVTLRPPLSAVELGTESGELTALVEGTASLAVDVETSSGSIETELPLRIRNASRHSLTGTVGAGQTPLILRTSSGDIHLTGGGR